MATQRTIQTNITADGRNSGILTIQTSEGTISVGLNDLSDEIKTQALMHGLKQKIVDAAAIGRNPETGKSATVKEKFAAMKEVADRLQNGEWNKQREAGTSTGGLLVRALQRLYPKKDAEEIQAFVEGKDRKEQAALRANPKVAAIIAEIRSENSEIDTDGLLGELK